MADIDVERKGPSIWPWIIGLIILALLIWLLAEWLGDDDDVVVEEPVAGVVEPAPVPPAPVTAGEPMAPMAGIPIGQITSDPAAWTGRTVEGEARVVEVPTDRGFWIEDQGQRVFAIINDQPQEEPKDINPEQRIRITGATVQTDPANVPGDLDQNTRNIIQGQPAFLVVDEGNINILEAGQPQPGTTPAQTAPTGGT